MNIKDEPNDTLIHATLRSRAELLIGEGTTPQTNGGSLNLDTLELLYRRVSNTESAADVLKLLHELQTHQVELDMLFQQLHENHDEMTEDLAYYRSVFLCAPVAYLIVAIDGTVIESNQAAAALFGTSAAQLSNHAVAELLTPASGAAMSDAIQALERPGAGVEFLAELQKHVDGGPTEPYRVVVSAQRDNSQDCTLMVFSPASGALPPSAD